MNAVWLLLQQHEYTRKPYLGLQVSKCLDDRELEASYLVLRGLQLGLQCCSQLRQAQQLSSGLGRLVQLRVQAQSNRLSV